MNKIFQNFLHKDFSNCGNENNIMNNKKIVAFDILRIFLIISIILFHSNSIGLRVLNNGYLAVECFFIISGYFLCTSYYRLSENNKSKNIFLSIIKKRFVRLYPSYLFITTVVLCLMYCGIDLQSKRSSFIDLGYNLIMFGDIGTVNNIIPGSWYVGALFWGNFILIALLNSAHDKAIYLFCPLIFIFSSVILFHNNVNSLMQSGQIKLVFLSCGVLRALAGLSCGMMAYYFSRQKVVIDFLKRCSNLIYSLFLIILMGFIYYLFVCKPSRVIYNIYFLMTPVVILLACRPSFGSFFLDRKIWSYLSNLTYMVFLINMVLLEILKGIKPFMEIQIGLRIVCAIFIIFIFAIICYHLQKWLFAKLKDILFVNTPQTASQNISGEK